MSDNEFRRNFRAFYKIWHHCKLSLLIIFTTLILTLAAVIMAIGGDIDITWGLKHPAFASFLLNEKAYEDDGEDMYANTDDVDNTDDKAAGNADDGALAASMEASENADEVSKDASMEASGDVKVKKLTEYEETKKTKVNSRYYTDPGKVALTTDYDYQTASGDYYNDALFIGDSRVVGLETYSSLKDEATFFAEEGLTVYSMMEKKIATVPGSKKKTTIPKALAAQSFGKIYIMVGINELGTGDTDRYKKQYEENINKIRSLQPNAKIIIMSVMRVTASTAKDPVVNNININDKNVAAASLADGVDIFYLDINPLFVTKKGDIKSEYTWDGVHLRAEYYKKWVDFLNEHGV